MAVVFQNTHSGQEPQHCGYCLLGRHFVDKVRLHRIQGECVGIPDLPVIVQCGRIYRLWLSHHYIGKSEQPGKAGVLPARVHHTDVWDKVSRHVKACKLYAVVIIFYRPEYAVRNSLRRLSLIISREHPVDVCIIHRPEPLADIHCMMVDRRHHKDLLAGGDGVGRLKLFQLPYDL